MMDMLGTDIKKLSEDLEAIRETVTDAAESAEATGERKFTLDDLKEQKTLVRRNGAVVQFNKVDHLTGRTPMERFFLRATNDVGALLDMSEEIKAKYENVLEFFGEDPQMPSNEFFGTMYRFMQEFKVSEKNVEKEERARQKERRRSEAKAKAAADKAAKATSSSDPAAGSEATIEPTRNGTNAQSTTATSLKDASSGGHPLAAMLAARQGDSGSKLKGKQASSSAHPLATMVGAGHEPQDEKTAYETTTVKSKQPSSSAHPLAAMLASRQAPEPKVVQSDQPSSSAHPLAAMLASRQAPEPKVVQSDQPSSSAHPLAAMLAARQDPAPKVVESDEPSSNVHPLSAMLAHPLASMLSSRQASVPKVVESDDPSSNAHALTAMLAARQQPENNEGASEKTSPSAEVSSTSHPSASISAARLDDSGQSPNAEEEAETSSVAQPLASILAEREAGMGKPREVAKVAPSPPSEPAPAATKANPVLAADDEVSQSTIEEAAALVAEEKSGPGLETETQSVEASSEPSAHMGDLAATSPSAVKTDSSVGDAHIATPQEATEPDNEEHNDNTSLWLAAVMEATGWERRRAAPKLAERGQSDESTPGHWVSRRQSMGMHYANYNGGD